MTVCELESSSTAAPLLNAYNCSTGAWNLPKRSEFWDAVDIAVGYGRKGAGRRIAIVDSAFDVSIPALAKQNLAWSEVPGEKAEHGTAVALLVHEVSPEANLDLFPLAIGGRIESGIAEKALSEISRSEADIINVSFGECYNWDQVIVPSKSNISNGSLYQIAHDMALDRRGRLKVDTQHLPLCRAAHAAVDAGKTVIAAIGNRTDKVYSPAIDDSVVACGFQNVRRAIRTDGRGEVAWSAAPSFFQSIVNIDMLLSQPPDVLGSSFASPLIAGFTALMSDLNELPSFLESARLAAIASSIEPSLSSKWSPDQHGVVDLIYKEAVLAAPHHHFKEKPSGPCPECALFARPAYVDYGLFKLNAGDLQGAELLLRAVRRFAPKCVPAAANLGVTLIEKAKQNDLAKEEVYSILLEAKGHFEFAVTNRPDHEPYQMRLKEIHNQLY